MKLFQPKKLVSIQWIILREHFKGAFFTVVAIDFLFLFFSWIITEILPWRESVESFLGFPIYSLTYFSILGMIFVVGTIFALISTIFVGYPLGNWLKKSLYAITDAAETFSRGKLDHRIQIKEYDEVALVALRFNQMADRIQNQVNSLQRLIDENARLVKETKYSATLDERRRLANELHDAISQQLFAISMTLASLSKMMTIDPENAKKIFLNLEGMVANAQQELRALIMDLRPITLEGSSLVEGVEKLLKELQQKHSQILWEWEVDKQLSLNQGIEDQLFRIIQEALSNMLRHSKAKRFRLKLISKKDRIFLVMEDNGVGFKILEKKTSSYGLTTMRERVEEIGGRLDILTYPNKGTRIEIRVPIGTGRRREVDG
ncbi:hypothetical protein BHF71_06625 [Vulcanibacillus modesticaldus]|uniref:histidine kinase n=1 Tax=Vulcanibacillus modesticaldus TaxID=337097 RepID=A0A1D2YWA8_9BACI|nr:sensor histidine kinase [Vulcanibacillus modesticaldus]OEG00031.1 hypothetical protein BHF71_06625 [Vulcanibacillus modesticaldus]